MQMLRHLARASVKKIYSSANSQLPRVLPTSTLGQCHPSIRNDDVSFLPADLSFRPFSAAPVNGEDTTENFGAISRPHESYRLPGVGGGAGWLVDPFSLVADEVAQLGDRMREMVINEVPKLSMAADYFFRPGSSGKRLRPANVTVSREGFQVLLLMASSIAATAEEAVVGAVSGKVPTSDTRRRQQRIAEITEMIHVASLLHDDVLDAADTRRGLGSVNFVMGNKLAVLAGDFLLARASVALASLRNTEVVELLSSVLEHLVTGEVMQMTAEEKQRCSMDYYLQKNFFKTASLLAHSCQAVAVLGNQPPPVAQIAFKYGLHLGQAFQLVDDALDFSGTVLSLGKPALADLKSGLATAPVLFAAEKHGGMTELIARKFSRSGDVEQACMWVKNSRGLEMTHELAAQHAKKAVDAILELPHTSLESATKCRQALIDITEKVLRRTK